MYTQWDWTVIAVSMSGWLQQINANAINTRIPVIIPARLITCHHHRLRTNTVMTTDITDNIGQYFDFAFDVTYTVGSIGGWGSLCDCHIFEGVDWCVTGCDIWGGGSKSVCKKAWRNFWMAMASAESKKKKKEVKQTITVNTKYRCRMSKIVPNYAVLLQNKT